MPMPALVPVRKPLGTDPEIEGVDCVGADIESVIVDCVGTDIESVLEDGAVVGFKLRVTVAGWNVLVNLC
jgi:hypothetical protein